MLKFLSVYSASCLASFYTPKRQRNASSSIYNYSIYFITLPLWDGVFPLITGIARENNQTARLE